MKLDYDVIRDLLINTEDLKPKDSLKAENEVENYHMVQLVEAGLANGNVQKYIDGSEEATIFRLTWEGHQFLETIRNDKVWNKTKSKLAGIGSFVFDIVKGVSIELLKEQLK